jgi:hypothetical protein
MNQLFNTVNYFEFQAFEALRRGKPPGVCRRKPESPFPNSYLKLVRYPRSLAPTLVTLPSMSRAPRCSIPPSYFFLLTFPIVPGNKKAAEAFLRAAAFG